MAGPIGPQGGEMGLGPQGALVPVIVLPFPTTTLVRFVPEMSVTAGGVLQVSVSAANAKPGQPVTTVVGMVGHAIAIVDPPGGGGGDRGVDGDDGQPSVSDADTAIRSAATSRLVFRVELSSFVIDGHCAPSTATAMRISHS